MFIESFDKTKIFYEYDKNSDLCLVFIHGWANDWTVWKKEILFFQEQGYSTLTLDLRGHGQSDNPEKKEQYHLECFAKDIHEIVKKEKPEHVVLIGHSLGGMIALTYYKLFPEHVKGLVLSDTTAKNIFENRKIEKLSPFIKHVLDFIMSHEKINKEHFKHLKDVDLSKYKDSSDYFIFYKGLQNTPMKSVFACLESMIDYDVTSMLGKIEVPVLIIQGEEDKILPNTDAFELYEEIPEAEMDFVPKGRYFVNLESPELVDKYIFNFLKKHQLGPPEEFDVEE